MHQNTLGWLRKTFLSFKFCLFIVIVGLVQESFCDGVHNGQGFGQRDGRQGRQLRRGGQGQGQQPRQQRQQGFQQQQQQQASFPSFPQGAEPLPFDDEEPVLSNQNLPPPPQPPILQVFNCHYILHRNYLSNLIRCVIHSVFGASN